MEKKYFDFHLHVFSKPMMTGYNLKPNTDGISTWDNIKTRIPCEPFARTFNSQSSFKQIRTFGTSLVVNALICPDDPILMADVWLDASILLSSHPDTIRQMRTKSPRENLEFELEVFDKDRVLTQTRDHVVYLDSIHDFEEEKINVLFAIEGGHNLYSRTADGSELFFDKDFLLGLKQGNPIRPLYITITHLARWQICNHCFGMKFLENFLSKEAIRKKIRPEKKGIYNLGTFMDLFNTCYSTDLGHKILLDIKHMSLLSRKQFYAIRRRFLAEGNHASTDFPIIVTHASVTGIPYSRFKERLDKKKITDKVDKKTNTVVNYLRLKCISRKGLQFYPTSMNFFDEELIEIVESEGLFGLTLDKRLLGGKRTRKKFKELEIFSNEELLELVPKSGPEILSLSDEDLLAKMELEAELEATPLSEEAFEELVDLESSEVDLDDFLKMYNEEEQEEEELDNDFYIKAGYVLDENKQIKFPDTGLELDWESVDVDQLKSTLEAEWKLMEELEAFPQLDIDDARKKFGDLVYFAHCILHFIEVTGEKGWNHICIGSDFDGLIEPLKLFESVDDLTKLEIFLLQLLPKMALKHELHVADIHELQDNIRKVLFENGHRLAKKHFV